MPASSATIAISIIVACEFEFGLAKIGPCRRTDNVRLIVTELPVVPFEPPTQEHYGDIRSKLEKAGKPIGPNDLLIAAHARALIGPFRRLRPGTRCIPIR